MWIPFSLLCAVASATTSLLLKQAVGRGGAILSTVAFRILAGVFLVGICLATDGWPALTGEYWRAVLLVMPPEVAGTLCMSLALRHGELSLVQPIMGLLPPFVMLGGALFLGEVPTVPAALGILLVTAGVYCVGLRPGASAMEPLRALTRTRASWFAVGAVLFWSITTVFHKVGIAAVGPFPWGATLALGSGLSLALVLPLLGHRRGGGAVGRPERPGRWTWLVVMAGAAFSLQQVGLHLALQAAQAGYVSALNATSIVIATGFGVFLLHERSAARTRLAGAGFVSLGAMMIGVFG